MTSEGSLETRDDEESSNDDDDDDEDDFYKDVEEEDDDDDDDEDDEDSTDSELVAIVHEEVNLNAAPVGVKTFVVNTVFHSEESTSENLATKKVPLPTHSDSFNFSPNAQCSSATCSSCSSTQCPSTQCPSTQCSPTQQKPSTQCPSTQCQPAKPPRCEEQKVTGSCSHTPSCPSCHRDDTYTSPVVSNKAYTSSSSRFQHRVENGECPPEDPPCPPDEPSFLEKMMDPKPARCCDYGPVPYESCHAERFFNEEYPEPERCQRKICRGTPRTVSLNPLKEWWIQHDPCPEKPGPPLSPSCAAPRGYGVPCVPRKAYPCPPGGCQVYESYNNDNNENASPSNTQKTTFTFKTDYDEVVRSKSSTEDCCLKTTFNFVSEEADDFGIRSSVSQQETGDREMEEVPTRARSAMSNFLHNVFSWGGD